MTTRDTPGVWLGVDVGTVRVGVARSDPAGTLALPVATLRRDRRGLGGIEERDYVMVRDLTPSPMS